ncbi:hypothetical protein GCM10010965_22360 [Caldalkalibacillus thermarum]|uniref:glycosyltransferase n=1 Tax=Caldalkalibacillus thermarum TaxID=296745 RepID=UPI001663FF85|nr:glycosyltransferase [Caldalkalibacillus thermarum]GGK29028.1 hypothetical protein GCM10010965_22360 [Caldalkalibacillus thermarum]
MKTLAYTALYVLSLYLNMRTLQQKLFQWILDLGRPYEQACWLYKIIVRLRKHRLFIEHVRANQQLGENEKRLLAALTWRHLRQYQRAWHELSPIPPGDERIDEIRVKSLYDLRNVEELLHLSDEVNLGDYLNDEQKEHIVRYAFRHLGPQPARLLAECFAQGDAESFFVSCIGKYRNLEEAPQNWNEFLRDHYQEFDLDREEEVARCLEWLNELPDEEGEFGLVLLMRHVAHEKELYGRVLRKLFKSRQDVELDKDLEGSAWAYLGLAQQAIQDRKYHLALHFALNAYKEGDKSGLLYDVVIESLAHLRVKRHEILDLQRMVDEGFIDLFSPDALQLLRTCKGFHHLYAEMDTAALDTKTLERLIQAGQALPSEQQQDFYHYIINALLAQDEPLQVDPVQLEQMEAVLGNDHLPLTRLRLRLYADRNQTDAIEHVLSSLNQEEKVQALLFISSYYYERLRLDTALAYADQAYQLAPRNIRVLRRLIGIHHRLGNISDRLKYLRAFRSLSGPLLGREYDMAEDEYRLLETNWQWDTDLAPIPEDERSERIIHVLNKSLPAINGYTVRSSEIVTHQQDNGLSPVVVTKLGWPPPQADGEKEMEIHKGIEHYRLYANKRNVQLNKVPMSEYFQAYADQFAQLVLKLKPKVIHAASNFQNALPALQVAKRLGIPCVYEVRGMWQDTQSSKTPGFYLSERYRLHQRYEVYCCQLADRVVAISESLREHLIELGVAADKIEVVPNGVDADRFVPRERDQEIVQRYALEDKLVFGFIGSVTPYEGLDYLLKALALLKEKRADFKCLIVGDGPALNELKHLAARLKLDEHVLFVGRVPHDEVQRYYSVIDVFPFPRTKAKVCELVTPLKPYEAMAMGKLVLVSDIPALREMVIEGETGLIFEAENHHALYETLAQAEQHLDLGTKSRTWVEQHRDWKKLIQAYPHIYEQAEQAAKAARQTESAVSSTS